LLFFHDKTDKSPLHQISLINELCTLSKKTTSTTMHDLYREKKNHPHRVCAANWKERESERKMSTVFDWVYDNVPSEAYFPSPLCLRPIETTVFFFVEKYNLISIYYLQSTFLLKYLHKFLEKILVTITYIRCRSASE
jgi:hypothetical protein